MASHHGGCLQQGVIENTQWLTLQPERVKCTHIFQSKVKIQWKSLHSDIEQENIIQQIEALVENLS